MPRIIPSEQFEEAIPGYVGEALDLARLVIGHAITRPSPNIQIQGSSYNPASNRWERGVTARDRLVGLIAAEGLTVELEVDADIDNGRLALQYHAQLGFSHSVRIWTYGLNLRNLAARPDANAQDPLAPGYDWLNSPIRKHPISLTMPGYVFYGGMTYANVKQKPILSTFVCPPDHRMTDIMNRYRTRAKEVTSADADYFRTALAPRCTKADEELLQGGVATYHTDKLGKLLPLLGGVTRE